MAKGTIRNESREMYKPSVVRSHKSSFERHIEPALGGVQLGKLKLRDLQDLVDRLALILEGEHGA